MISVTDSKHGKWENEHMKKNMMWTITFNFSARHENSSSEDTRASALYNGVLDIYVLEVVYDGNKV